MTRVPAPPNPIHTPEFWRADEAERRAFIEPFANLHEAEVTPIAAYQLGLLAIQETVRLSRIVRSLALETQPRKRGRPPKPRTDQVAIVDHHIQLNSWKLTPEQARALGASLIQAANHIEGVLDEGTIAE